MVKLTDIKSREPTENLRGRTRAISPASPSPSPNILNEDLYEQIRKIEISKLVSFKNQARKHFNEEGIESLSQTIKEHGVRQPLTVIENVNQPGFFEVVSGERRLRAAKAAGLIRIPCIIVHDEKKAEEIALIENVQREDLHPVELGQAYFQLIQTGICSTQEDISKRIGVNKSQVSEYIKYANLPEPIKEKIISSNLSRRAFLRNILRTYSSSKMNELIDFEINLKENGKTKLNSRSFTKTLLTIYEHNGEIKVNASGYHDCHVKEKNQIKEILEELLNTP